MPVITKVAQVNPDAAQVDVGNRGGKWIDVAMWFAIVSIESTNQRQSSGQQWVSQILDCDDNQYGKAATSVTFLHKMRSGPFIRKVASSDR